MKNQTLDSEIRAKKLSEKVSKESVRFLIQLRNAIQFELDMRLCELQPSQEQYTVTGGDMISFK